MRKTVMKNILILMLLDLMLISGPCFAEGNASNPLTKPSEKRQKYWGLIFFEQYLSTRC